MSNYSNWYDEMQAMKLSFICSNCKAKGEEKNSHNLHDGKKSKVCTSCFIELGKKWEDYTAYIEEKYQVPTIKEYFKN